jgi:SAM-dependent methyltransferase
MDEYTSSTYGDRIADVYDRYYSAHDAAAIATLKRLAGSGPALELGIGTGRIALPLAEAGVAVQGIDASEAMVAKLRAKPGGAKIPVHMGDLADVAVEGRFSLVYVVFNTIFAPLTQADQVRCFRNVARHLAPGGVFVLEAFVPDLGRFRQGQNVSIVAQDSGEIRLDVAQVDPVTQVVTAHHVILGSAGTRFDPVKLRYAWPSELDLMAQLAGMTLKHRWGDWEERPFTAATRSHVSVYALE